MPALFSMPWNKRFTYAGLRELEESLAGSIDLTDIMLKVY